ncbi:MAG: LamG domain-containing protein [Anaerolineaceae bacterium]|nr:LamG domain-containing protein [Anaerolineaceae bacterium]
MKLSKRHLSRIALVCGLLGCIVMAWLLLGQTPSAQAHQRAVESAWDLLGRLDFYRFSTTIEQRVFPAPMMANAGQSSQLEIYNADGWSRLPEGELLLSFWDDDSIGGAEDALEIKYEQGEAFSRMGKEGEWRPIDDDGGMLIAPGKDPASFLSAARAVRLVNCERIQLPQADGSSVTLNVKHYSFDLDGTKFAAFMRDQMIAELQRSGELPAGISLSLSDKLIGMDGSGQAWIDEDGMLVRTLVEIRFPDEANGEHMEAKISTTYYGVSNEDLMAAKGLPAQFSSWFNLPTTTTGWTQVAFTGGLTGAFFLLFYGLISNANRRWCYAIVAVLVIASMLIEPLWRSAKAASFSLEQHEKSVQDTAERERVEKERSAINDLLTSSWNPKVSPLEQKEAGVMLDPIRASIFTGLPAAEVGSTQQDTDGDGLTDEYEDEYGPTVLDKTKADTDGDGLLDGEELPLGLFPGIVDSDNDQISDHLETVGFYFDTGMWYTNPVDYDTDLDGVLDGVECPQRAMSADDPAVGVCGDTDGDGTPDVFDPDDDGDGVPTVVDATPFTLVSQVFSPSSPLVFEGSGAEADMPLFLTYQFRPTVEEHLTYTQNVLDWPEGDVDGQVQQLDDATFADISETGATAGDPRASYGDMRLIPMAEVRLKGDSLPLALTDHYEFPISSDAFEGTVELTALSATQTRVTLTEAPAGSHPIYVGSGSCDDATNVTAVGSLAEGESLTVDISLGSFADGTRPIQVRDAALTEILACQEAYPVAHGTLADRVVDESVIHPYGIFARTDADTGEVVLYGPLQLEYNEAGSMPVAFTTRLPLTNEGNRFNDSYQEVSLVWALNLITDVCKPMDPDWDSDNGDWCDANYPEHFVQDVTRIVHTYPEQFTLTGLSISEQHGVEMAVVFEDPATDSSPEFSDPLWGMANGLEKSFLSGRATSGERDLTVADIRDRFDPDYNSSIADGDDRLWGFAKDAFQVVYVDDIPSSDGLVERMQTLSTDIFEGYYDGLTNPPEVTLMIFAREIRERSTGLGAIGNECYSGSSPDRCTLSLAGEDETVQAVMNWSPYERDGTTWRAMEIEDYLDRLEARWRTLDEYKPDGPSGKTRDEIDGTIFVARMYAEMVNAGMATLVELNGTPVVNGDNGEDDVEIETFTSSLVKDGLGAAKLAETFAEIFLDSLAKQPLLNMVMKLGSTSNKVSAFFETVTSGLKDKFNSLVAKYLNTTLRKVAASVAAIILVAGIVACMIIELASPDSQAGRIAGRILGTTFGVMSTLLAIKGLVELYKAIQIGQTLTKAAATAAIVGLIIGIVIVWAMFFVSWGMSGVSFGSLAFNNMVAEAMAATMSLVLMAAIALIFPVGTVIAAVIGLIDALIMTVCAAAGASDLGEDHWVNKYICIGLSGWVTKIFKWVLYGVHYMIDYSSGERLEFGSMDQQLQHPELGYIETNNLKVTIETTNTITKESIPLDWKSLAYFWQWSDSNASSANFQYQIQTSETDFHDGLERGEMAPAWERVGSDDVWKATVNATTSGYAVDLPDAGVNRDPVVYLSEASAVPVQECWAIPPIPPIPTYIPVCYIRTERATIHVDLASSMTVDVFPATLDLFYELAESGSGGYTFAWGSGGSPTFPVFRDADGDTLVSTYYQGNDPNDADFDNDNDGLSDAFEVQNGLNPSLPDTDDDGLLDGREVALGTDPTRPDSDGDGLPDNEEVSGWYFVYGFDASGKEMRTRVYPDPLMVDTDLDGLTDKQEQVYGFHPGVFSNANILEYEIDTREQDASLVMLKLDENGGANMFMDTSNFNFHASCQGDTCPEAGFAGRYGQAVEFDGGLISGDAGDVLEVSGSPQGLSFTGGEPFALAFWVQRQGSGTILSKWSETAGELKEFKLEMTSDGFLRLVNQSDSAAVSSTAVPASGWTHVTVSYDGTNATFLLNGVSAGSQAWANPTTTGTTVPLYVGAALTASGLGEFFAGRLDEVLIFNRSLDASEVAERIMAARYNVNDQFVRPGEFIEFMSTVTNLLNNRFGYGLLNNQIEPLEAVVDAEDKLLPRTFVVYPDTPEKLNTFDYSEQLQIEPTYSTSGDLTLGQTADAQIVDRQTESNYAELYLRFNEAAGATRFEDFSGAAPQRSATCTSCPTAGVASIMNQAVRFESGANTPLDLTDLDTFSMLNRGYTISMWINPAATSTSGAVLSLLHSEDGLFSLSLVRQASGNYVPRIVMSGQTWDASAWRSVLSGVWNHLVVRYNDNDRQVQVYINGALIHTRSNVNPLTANSEMWVGGSPQQSSYIVDDLRLYSRPLSTLDINRLAERPVIELDMDTASYSDSSGNNQSVAREVSLQAPDPLSVRGTSLNPKSYWNMNYLYVNGNPLLNMADGAFTFSVWLYPQSTSEDDWQGVFGYESGRSDAYPTLERLGRKLRLSFGTGSTTYTNSSEDVLTENRWNHVVVTFQPNTDPAMPSTYQYRLYVNAVYVDGDITGLHPSSNDNFYVGHSSHRWSVTANNFYVSSHGDPGKNAEVRVDKEVGSGGWNRIWSGDVQSDNWYDINDTTYMTTYSSVSFDVWEDDVTGDDDCGSGSYVHYNSPGSYSLGMSDGFNGTMYFTVNRQSIRFIGRIDELAVYRYALDSEQIYDLYYALPVTARMPLNDRPASDSFVNTAEVTTLDDGTCVGSGCPAAGGLGLLDQAVEFGGVDDIIKVPNRDVTSDYMVSFWMNTTCEDCGIYSLYPTTPGTTAMQQVYLRNGNVCALAASTEVCSTGGGISDGRWHSVLYANNNGVTNLWVDGAIVDSRGSGSGMVTASTTAEAQLGYAANGGEDYYTGLLDDVRVFRHTLTTTDILNVINRSPLLLAHMDEAQGETVFLDSTRYGQNLDCAGDACPLAGQPGRLGGAAELDGADDLITLEQTQLSTDAGSFSVSMWVYPTRTLDAVQTLWAMPYADNNRIRYSLALAPNTMNLCIVNGEATAACTASSVVGLIKDNWNHVTLVVERLSSTSETAALYINGYIDSTVSGNQSTNVATGLGQMTLGGKLAAHTAQAGGPFAGKLDEVTVYPYELNEINVRDSFNYQIAHVEEHASVRLTIDAEAPQVSLAGYDPNFAYIQESDIQLVAPASDLTSGIALVEMSVAHRNLAAPSLSTAPVCLDSRTGEDYCPTLRADAGDGLYTVSFRAVDRVGHQTTSEGYKLYADGEAPRIVVNFVEGALLSAEMHPEVRNTWMLSLSGSVQDPELGDGSAGSALDMSSVKVSIVSADGAVIGAGAQTPLLEKDPSGPGYLWSLDYMMPEGEPSGQFTLVVEAADRVNNRAVSQVGFSIDATAPAAQIDLTGLPEEDEIMSGQSFGGQVSDVPGDGLPYTPSGNNALAVNVAESQAGFLPVGTTSFLQPDIYPDGLLLWLPMDKEEVPLDENGDPNPEDPNRTFIDISPYQISGSCSGAECPQTGLIGHRNASMYFNGNEQTIRLGTQVDLAGRSFTVAVWGKRNELNHNDPILWQGPLSLPDERMVVGINTQNQFVCGFGGSDLLSGAAVVDTEWHMWACSYDLDSGLRVIYQDGQALASDTASPLPVTYEAMFVGQAPVGSYYGYLDELQIFDHSLDEAAVRELYTGSQTVFHLSVDTNFAAPGDVLEDSSGYFHNAELIGGAADKRNKVGSGASGSYDLELDGDDWLMVEPQYSLNLNRGPYTLSAWVRPDAAAAMDIISQRTENPEWRYPSLALTADLRLQTGFGSGYDWVKAETSAPALTVGEWALVTVTFDGQTVAFYVNGVLVEASTALSGQTPYPGETFNIGDRFQGGLDEIMVFPRALGRLEVAALAGTGWVDTQLAENDIETSWTTDVPAGIEGIYQLGARGLDTNRHVKSGFETVNQWDGTVDNLAPRIQLNRTLIGEELYEYSFSIEDVFLDEDSVLINVCPAVTVTRTYNNSEWVLAAGVAPNTFPFRLEGTCQAETNLLEEVGVYACDGAGNCSAEFYPPKLGFRTFLPLITSNGGGIGGTAEVVDQQALWEKVKDWSALSEAFVAEETAEGPQIELVTTQLGSQHFRSGTFFPIKGRVSDPSGTAWVEIRISRGSEEVYRTRAAVYGEQWTAMWAFLPGAKPQSGYYVIDVTAYDKAGNGTANSYSLNVDLGGQE